MREKGFARPLVLVGVTMVIAAGVIGYFLLKPKPPKLPQPTTTPQQTSTPQAASPTQTDETANLNLRPNAIDPKTYYYSSQSGIAVSIFCVDKIYVQPCGKVGGMIVKTTDGLEITRQESNETGKFNVYLQPGDYQVTPLPGSSNYFEINFEPRQIKVTTDQFSEIKLSYTDGRK